MFNLRVLCKEETEKLLKMEDVIPAVEAAYAQKASDNANIFDWVFHEFEPGVADMDIKSGWLQGNGVFGMKLVSWYSKNKAKNLPQIIGTIMVFDDKTGQPIGLVDGAHITGMRTGAAGAIGAKYLANKNSETLLMVGTGHISKFEIAATLIAIPTINEVIIHDPITAENAEQMASDLKQVLADEFNISRSYSVLSNSDLEDAVKRSQIIITATPSKSPMIMKEWVQPGTHFSCVGADMPGKEEIDPELFVKAKVFVDDLKQCSNIGEIEIPIKKGLLDPKDVLGEIGDLVNATVTGRTAQEDITIFDATGTALLDLITAQLAFEKADEKQIGTQVNL